METAHTYTIVSRLEMREIDNTAQRTCETVNTKHTGPSTSSCLVIRNNVELERSATILVFAELPSNQEEEEEEETGEEQEETDGNRIEARRR